VTVNLSDEEPQSTSSTIISVEPVPMSTILEKVEGMKNTCLDGVGLIMESFGEKIHKNHHDLKDDVDDVKDMVIEGFENLSGILDATMERVTLKTNGLYTAICGRREEPSLEAKLNMKIEMQTEEIKSLKTKLDENKELLTQIIKRLG
jgi:predicted RNase H-like nuclease (RuvC/YqgF family)